MPNRNQTILLDTGLASVTDFYEANATLNPQALGKAGRSDRREVFAVIIQNRLTNLDNTNNVLDLLVGTGGGCVWQLLPGAESPLIHTRNLNDVFVKVRAAVIISEALGTVTAVTIAAGGLGYTVGDVLFITGGDGTARIQVTSVNGAGAVLTVVIFDGGDGYAIAAGVATTGGTGAGATVNITAVLDQVDSVAFPFICYRHDPGARRI